MQAMAEMLTLLGVQVALLVYSTQNASYMIYRLYVVCRYPASQQAGNLGGASA